MRHSPRCLAALLIVTACSGDAPSSSGRLLDDVPLASIEEDMRIDAEEADLVRISWIGVRSDDVVALIQGQDHLIKFFDAEGGSLGSFGRQGEGPGEFDNVLRGGWRGDTLWVSDMSHRTVTLIAPDLANFRTLPPLGAVRPAPEFEGIFPGFSMVAPYGLAEGDTALVSAIISDGQPAPEENTVPAIFRVTSDGVLGARVLVTPSDDRAFVEMGRVPFFPYPEWAVAPDASRLATLTVDDQVEGPDTFRVTVLGPRGDSLHETAIAYEPVAIPQSTVDSVVEARVASRAQIPVPELRLTTPAMQNELRDAIPAAWPPATMIVFGNDQRIWVELRPEADGRPWLAISPEGEPMYRVKLPPGNRLGVADDTHIWAVETDDFGLQHVVRYRIGPSAPT